MFETQIAALAERDAVLAERDAALESERLARSHLERELADA